MSPSPSRPRPRRQPPAGGETYTIAATASDTIGTYLTGEDGKTLYFFVPDAPGVSVCTGDCAGNWPPFVLEGGEQAAKGDGVTGVVGVIARTDPEGQQVTYDGRPLYYYAGDANGRRHQRPGPLRQVVRGHARRVHHHPRCFA